MKKIKKTYIRSTKQLLQFIKDGQDFYLGVQSPDTFKTEILLKAGFDAKPKTGESIIPEPIGKVTIFNSQGKDITRKDLEKEHRYTHTVEREWTDWRGDIHYGTIDFYRYCYPREHINPPYSEVMYIEKEKDIIISKKLRNTIDNEQDILHNANMFFEIFGECHVFTEKDGIIAPKIIHKPSWEPLPPGEHPFERVKKHIQNKFIKKSKKDLFMSRLDFLYEKNHNKIYVGRNGFRGYVAFYFDEIIIVENPHYGNATYIFESNIDFDTLKLSKKEIIDEELYKDRIVHNKNWKKQINKTLNDS